MSVSEILRAGSPKQRHAKRPAVKVVCANPTCGKEFYKSPSTIIGRTFCSMQCMGAFRKGRHGPQKPPRLPKTDGETILIALTRGKLAIVDLIDADLAKTNWYARISTGSKQKLWYAGQSVTFPKKTVRRMHRVIMERVLGRPLTNLEEVDHKNHNGLDNRRSNLRLADSSQNHANSRPRANATSVYKGVYFSKQRGYWCAQITVNNRGIYLGSFNSEMDAAKAYDRAAREHFGEFASTNFGKVA